MSDPTPPRKGPQLEETLVDRRTVLKWGGVSMAVAALPTVAGCATDVGGPEGGPPEVLRSSVHSAVLDDALWVDVLRREDLVVLRLALVNLEIRNKNTAPPPAGLTLTGNLYLAREAPRADAFIVVFFQPQHIHEDTLPETGSAPATQKTMKHLLASGSRVAFQVPSGVTAIPYELDKILAAIATYELNVAATATPEDPERMMGAYAPVFVAPAAGPPANSRARAQVGMRAVRAKRAVKGFAAYDPDAISFQQTSDPVITVPPPPMLPQAPGSIDTSIELPFKLLVSPNVHARFQHAAKPVTSALSNRVELWQTRLTTPYKWQKTIRAVWSRDGVNPNDFQAVPATTLPVPPGTLVGSLQPRDRTDIVHLTTNQSYKDKQGKTRARAVPVDTLSLGALGGAIDADVEWTDGPITPAQPSLVRWAHHAALGRDQQVIVTNVGSLYPCAPRAIWTTVSERKLRADAPDVAYLWRRSFVRCTEPLVPLGHLTDLLARGLPFKSIRFKTLVTPNVGKKTVVPGFGTGFPTLDNEPFLFDLQAFDHDGNPHDLTMPFIWIDAADYERFITNDGDFRTKVETAWLAAASHVMTMKGQRVSLAPSDAIDDARYTVSKMALKGVLHVTTDRPPYVPQLEFADLSIDAVRGITGSSAPSRFAYHDTYKQQGFDATHNKGAVFMEAKPGGEAAATKLELSKQSHRSGGFVSPSMAVGALSRSRGIVGGSAANAVQATMVPADFFAGVKAKLFGVVDLFSIIVPATTPAEFEAQTPTFLTQGLQGPEAIFEIAERVRKPLARLAVQIPAIQTMIDALPANPASVPESQRVAPASYTPAQAGLYLRVFAKAAALGAGKGPIQQAKTDLLPKITDVSTALEAFDTAMEAAGSAPDAHAAAATIGNAVGIFRQELLEAAIMLEDNPLPIDDGDRLQLRKSAATMTDLLAAGTAALQAFEAVVETYLTAEESLKDLRVKLEWAPRIQEYPKGPTALFWPNDPNGLRLSVETRAKSGAQQAGADIHAALTDFELRLIGEDPFLKLKFDRLVFKTTTGGKPEIDCVFRGLEFGGPLSFVETLREFIPLDGFSDPPNVTVDETGLRAGFSLPLPNIAVGIFSLENISFNAGFEIPFVGESLLATFSFCTRESPFRLTVCMLGGGGFFGLSIAPDGVRLLEISLEATASLSVNFGVASGSVSLALGIYMAIEASELRLTGYLRIRGEVDVLGMITASIELRMELTYEPGTGKVIGYASLEIEIDVFVFSGTVTLEVERKFAGGNADPTFRELMAPDPLTQFHPWDEYCDAFAA